MKRVLLAIVIAVVVAAIYWLVSPLFLERRVNEELPAVQELVRPNEGEVLEMAKEEVLGQGSFVGLANHDAEGHARILKIGEKNYLRLEENFRVTNGPDLFIYLGRDGKHNPEARLGALKGNAGSQNYEIPDSLNLADYNEVWVWCRAFSVPFGKAVVS